jgi:type II secretory ATPase GspE/PulE/Tfp pilus assembly ATPase PilB-like protein
VILVGEIRDPETAAVAVQAAMTGHLVLASVHANDALAVLPRLRDMGLEPYQLAAGFRGAVAQRLVRRLCQGCAADGPPTETEQLFAATLGKRVPKVLKHAVGCPACKRTGFKWRVPIGEAFQATDEMLRGVAERRPAAELEEIARRSGLTSMISDGFDKACAGETTVEEVVAAVHG